MAALMPCSLTVEGVTSRLKTVTRRDVEAWVKLKPGDRLTLVKQRQGIPKGGHVERLAEVVVTSVRLETLGGLTSYDVQREAVNTDLSALAWAKWWAHAHGWRPVTGARADRLRLTSSIQWWQKRGHPPCSLLEIPCRRIEWAYLDDDPDECAYFDPWPCETCDAGARPRGRASGASAIRKGAS